GSCWAIGVAKETFKRTNYVYMSPENGVWALCHSEGQLLAMTFSRTSMDLCNVPSSIWVGLDCSRGLVTFINGDNGDEIF
ncbi:BT1A1 protein, partial [Rhinopomastus cyanomelas]|nr:BT1A1 protein [Rhinopomastus cyanomelas]